MTVSAVRKPGKFDGFRAHRCVLRVFLYLCAITAQLALAHDPGLSSVTVDLVSKEILVQGVFAGADLGPEVIHESQAAAFFELRTGGDVVPPRQVEVRPIGTDVEVTFRFPRSSGPTTLRSAMIAKLPFGHRQAVTVRDAAGDTVLTEVLAADRDVVALPSVPAAPALRRRTRYALAFGSVAVVVAAWATMRLLRPR